MKRATILEALEGIREELSGIRIALTEREKDISRRFATLESEQARLSRRQLEVEAKLSRGPLT